MLILSRFARRPIGRDRRGSRGLGRRPRSRAARSTASARKADGLPGEGVSSLLTTAGATLRLILLFTHLGSAQGGVAISKGPARMVFQNTINLVIFGQSSR